MLTLSNLNPLEVILSIPVYSCCMKMYDRNTEMETDCDVKHKFNTNHTSAQLQNSCLYMFVYLTCRTV